MKNTPFAHYQRTQYNPAHYRFARRIEGYHPEPDAKPIDRLIGRVCTLAILGYLVYCALGYPR
jgi:hypothetical protein